MMDSSFINAIADLATRPELREVDGREYSNIKLHEIIPAPAPLPKAVQLSTLTGLIDFLNATSAPEPVFLHVANPGTVFVTGQVSPEDYHQQRRTYAVATYVAPPIGWGSYMDLETLIVTLQALFVTEGSDKLTLLKLLGNIRHEAVRTQDDDGFTQTVTAKKGVALAQAVSVPNPVHLKPYRTFPEVEQPGSPFVLRLRGGGEAGPVQAALHEADGGTWRNVAILAIAAFLRDKTSIPVLA